MDHGRDEHSLITHTVDDAIAVDEEFADGFVAELGDGATGESRSMYSAMASTSSSASGDQVTRWSIERAAAQLAPG